jgi:predicted ATP-dependent protease
MGALEPEPIALDVTVILYGPYDLYSRLCALDDDFQKVFKVRVDFESTTEWGPRLASDYADFCASLAASEGLAPLTSGAVAALIEQAVRRAGRKGRVSVLFGHLADRIREADQVALENGHAQIQRQDMLDALAQRRRRLSLSEERMRRRIRHGQTLIACTGTALGRVNGLVVYSNADHAFGAPARVSAVAQVGRGAVINVERESRLSGRSFDKGGFLMQAWLRSRFARDRPLALQASMTVEQHYGHIDGDSATTAELCALMSAIAGYRLRQDLAVTGSMNQHGDIQPVGGVNEKVEGWYRVCRDMDGGLTGTQGVILPRANVDDLVLGPEVVKAVDDGRFHLYGVRSIEEILALLSGRPLARRGRTGYPAESAMGYVQKVLWRWSERMYPPPKKGKAAVARPSDKPARVKATRRGPGRPGTDRKA